MSMTQISLRQRIDSRPAQEKDRATGQAALRVWPMRSPELLASQQTNTDDAAFRSRGNLCARPVGWATVNISLASDKQT